MGGNRLTMKEEGTKILIQSLGGMVISTILAVLFASLLRTSKGLKRLITFTKRIMCCSNEGENPGLAEISERLRHTVVTKLDVADFFSSLISCSLVVLLTLAVSGSWSLCDTVADVVGGIENSTYRRFCLETNSTVNPLSSNTSSEYI